MSDEVQEAAERSIEWFNALVGLSTKDAVWVQYFMNLRDAYLAEHQADGKETLADMIDKDDIDLSQQEVIDSTAGMRYRNAKLYYTEWAERTEKTS